MTNLQTLKCAGWDSNPQWLTPPDLQSGALPNGRPTHLIGWAGFEPSLMINLFYRQAPCQSGYQPIRAQCGIRTREELTLARFAVWCLRPLGYLGLLTFQKPLKNRQLLTRNRRFLKFTVKGIYRPIPSPPEL